MFLFHWKEESQHAVMDEMEWLRENEKLTPAQRDAAVDDLIGLVGAVDGILQAQSKADADYFLIAGRTRLRQRAKRRHRARRSCARTAGSTSSPACRTRASTREGDPEMAEEHGASLGGDEDFAYGEGRLGRWPGRARRGSVIPIDQCRRARIIERTD